MPAYTGHVGCRGSIGLFAIAAALLCLPGTLRAQGENLTYRLALPQVQTPSTVELSVAYPLGGGSVKAAGGSVALGDWEITASLDLENCAIVCVYRRVRYSTHLMPPVAEIRVFTDPAGAPTTLTVDPANTHLPMATGNPVAIADLVYLPGRRASVAVPAQIGQLAAILSPLPPRASSNGPTATGLLTCSPLRI